MQMHVQSKASQSTPTRIQPWEPQAHHAALSHLPCFPATQVAPRELIDWCAARLAHYKVPAAMHVLPKMPTTGSGKILKTELRKMFGGGGGAAPAPAPAPAGAAAAAPAPAPAGPAAPEPTGVAAVDASVFGPEAVAALSSPRAPAASLAEAAAVLAAACGGGVSCQPLDAGFGTEWGRELLPSLTYLLVVERAADIGPQVGRWVGPDGVPQGDGNRWAAQALQPCLLRAPLLLRF